ncbi:3,4-dihydroxy-2-butanone 4-phosphate synthase-domain-containing protein [Pavlovales sp. CCMP2436]|nr:3,4-dihydroxy-2-butanone 4-phosphate synthase-domain-containing protein [Pavlovales sp. CCMP2436]
MVAKTMVGTVVGLLLLLQLPAGAAVSGVRPARAGAAHAGSPPPRRRASRLRATPGAPESMPGDAAQSVRPGGFGEQSVVAALAAIKRGEMVIVTDDEARENEGDLIMAAEHATPETIAFMVRHTSGVLCIGMEDERIRQLQLPQMTGNNEDPKGTAFTISVDARTGTTTGISAGDRAETLRQLANPDCTADDFQRPGHIFPLRSRKHGVLARQGHTEAAVDMCRLAGLQPAGVLSEIVSADGLTMARMPELIEFGKAHNLVMTTITDLVGDVFGSLRCDCGTQLESALRKIESEGRGVLLYLRGQEGRGIGLGHKIRAYALQDTGRDTVQANLDLGLPVDARDYGVGAQQPPQYAGLSGYGLSIAERVPCITAVNAENVKYLRTKQQKMGHWLPEGFDEEIAVAVELGLEAIENSAEQVAELIAANARILTLDAWQLPSSAACARRRTACRQTG